MKGHALAVAVRLLAISGAALALGTQSACPFITAGCGDDTGWRKPQPIELGVDVDLEAVIRLHDNVEDQYWTNLAVGSGGTVVAWGETIGDTVEPFVDHFLVGGSVLRGAAVTDTGWWVVGDGGILAVSETRGQMWSIIDLGFDTDFHAITSHLDKLVIVGDDIVVTQDAGGNWVEIPAPPASNGGWGQLRGLYGDGTRIWAVGLAGVVWSCTDPLGEWTAESIGVNNDLFGVCGYSGDTQQVMIVGAQGTVVLGDPGADWTTIDTNTSVDFLDCSESTLLAADGAVTELRSEGDFVSVGTFSGALGIWHEAQNDLVAVGAAGMAARIEDSAGC